MKFRPDYMFLRNNVSVVSKEDLKKEPMLYSASLDFARKNGGALTNKILDRIDSSLARDIAYHANKGYHPVIDTKVVMLKKGWYPSIPGWHCDNVPRGENGQPDMTQLYDQVYHYICNYSTDNNLCPTEILRTEENVDIIKSQVWKSVDSGIREKLALAAPSFKDHAMKVQVRSGQIVRFSRQTLHNCSPANKDGWRMFFRLSFMATPARNEIRNQVQIYTDVNQGW